MRLALILAGALAVAAPAAAQHANHADHGAAPKPAAPVKGTGVVKGVNAKAGTITLHHGPVPALKWPAMTMTFKAAPEVVKAARTGKSVTFTLSAAGDQVLSLQ